MEEKIKQIISEYNDLNNSKGVSIEVYTNELKILFDSLVCITKDAVKNLLERNSELHKLEHDYKISLENCGMYKASRDNTSKELNTALDVIRQYRTLTNMKIEPIDKDKQIQVK